MKKETEDRYNTLFKKISGEGELKLNSILNGSQRTYLPLGSKIGKYKILEEIDRGGMAVVYKCNQLDLDRIVALKVLPANITINDNFVNRFLSEAHAVAKLQHPNIVNIHEVAIENNIYYLAMDYVHGKSLFYYLHQEKPKVIEVLEIVRQLSDALAYAHSQKILHRDLKLNNVIMRDNNTPVLIDFGLAKAIGAEDANLTKTGEIIGSPSYMAPERVFGKGLDARSDVCSLGIMLYEMLTFKNPYLDPRSMIQTTKNVIEATPVPPRNLISWLPIEVESITLKAMSKEPEDRYQSMNELGEDIQRYQRGEEVLASPPSLWSKIERFLRKNWAPLVISSIVLLFTALLAIIINIQSGKEKSHWQLSLNEKFNKSETLKDWFIFSEGLSNKQRSGVWSILDSTLYVESSGYSYIRYERPFARDIKVEFDIKPGLKDLFNVGFFICGYLPENGYCFFIHQKSAALNGVTYPESKFLFYDYKPAEFPIDSQYHAVVEKKDNIITFWLNDMMISKVCDFFPTQDSKHQKIGFFVNGSTVSFDNLKIYRRAIPRLARPTIIADRFWEQGDFETALAEYKEVLLDFSRSNIACHIKFRMVDCLIRLNNFTEAENILAEIEAEKKINEPDRARILFLKGMLNERKGTESKMNQPWLSLAKFFPSYPINKSVAAYMAMKCYDLFISEKYDSAEAMIEYITKKYSEFSHHFGRIHLEILEYYTSQGIWNRAQKIGKVILSLHEGDNEIISEARILIAKTHLGRRNKYKAIDILNKCLVSPQPSVAKWHAWMVLGEVNEYDCNYKDAITIYNKILTDCPTNLPISWMARIKSGEIAKFSSPGKKADTTFEFVINEPHVFIEPRLIAQYYTNLITWEYFKRQWILLKDNDLFYLYYLSRKNMMLGKNKKAQRYLKNLINSISRDSWDYIRIKKILKGLK